MYGRLEGIEQVSVLALVCDIGGIIATLHLCDTVRFSYCFLIHNSSNRNRTSWVFDSDAKSRIVVLGII